MANTLTLASKITPMIDQIYKMDGITSTLDTRKEINAFTGVNEIKVWKMSSTGLGNYSRTTGYPAGNVKAELETFKLTQERGAELLVDRLDDEETLGLVFGEVIGRFVREHVTPEIDAYRFAKYCSASGVEKQTGTLDADTLIPALDEAIKFQDANEVPLSGRMLFISTDLKPVLANTVGRYIYTGNSSSVGKVVEDYNGIPITYVPPTRFYSAITLNDGSSEWGYKKTTSGGKDINFILMRKDALIQGVKFSKPKIFTPDVNQELDAWKFQFRMYHDAFVYDNKVKGIYAHTKDS